MSALLQPAGVGGHVGLGLEGQGAHVVHEQGHAFLGQGGPEGVHGLERGIELHQPVELLGRLGDARILGPPPPGSAAGWGGPPPTGAAAGPSGSSPSNMDSRLVPVRGSPTMIHGLSMRSARTSGCSTDQRWRAIRLARAEASILEIRMRPKVVRSASLVAGRRGRPRAARGSCRCRGRRSRPS